MTFSYHYAGLLANVWRNVTFSCIISSDVNKVYSFPVIVIVGIVEFIPTPSAVPGLPQPMNRIKVVDTGGPSHLSSHLKNLIHNQ